MNELKLQIELCEEDRKRLDTIIDGLVQLARGQYRIEAAVENAGTPFKEEPATDEEQNTAEPEHVEAVVYSAADISKKVRALAMTSAREQARAIIKMYAPKVPELKPEDYPAVMAALDELEKGLENGAA